MTSPGSTREAILEYIEDQGAAGGPEIAGKLGITRQAVKLLRRNYVSRSEAKRLLHNLDRFSEIELDMRGVGHVGQGFADEVFRVFRQAHPGIRIEAVHASPAVAAMIAHARTTGE